MKLQEVRLNQDPDEEVKYVIFCDLDGVLADFKASIQKVMDQFDIKEAYSEEKWASDPKYRSRIWNAVTAYQKKHGPVLWRDLEVMPDAHELWNYIAPKGAQVLTATGDPKYGSAEQKRAWFTEHFGSAARLNIVRSAPDKAQFAGPHHILIDDQARATKPFEAAGGIGIVHTSAASTIAALKKLGV